MPMKPRIENLAAELSRRNLDVFLAQDPYSMDYLHGFREGSLERFLSLAVHRDGSSTLICPALTETQARRSGIDSIRAWADGQDPMKLVQDLAREWDFASGGIAVDDQMPASFLLELQGALPSARFVPGSPVLGELMSRKDERELELLQRAATIADRAFAQVLPTIEVGWTETRVAAVLAQEMSELGGKPSFTIVATGAFGAEPHHENSDAKLEKGQVLVLDFGCEFGGYQSDITRTVSLGPNSEKAHRVYEIVYRAHMAGRNAIRPGIAAQDVDRATRAVVVEAGFGAQFFHRTGHGIGMRGHEAPFIVEGAEKPLSEGNCFSIEPGIYLAGEFGVRIENIVTVTPNGHRSLNEEPSPKLLEI